MNRTMKIIIDENIPFIRGAFERWADVVYAPGRAINSKMVAHADALIVRTRTKCNADLLSGSSVRIVATATIGFDHIDTVWLEQNGIKWANAPGCNSGSVMQYVTSLLLFLAKKHSFDPGSMTLGVVGVGNVGSRVARAANALGMRVLLNDPPRQRREEGRDMNTGGSDLHKEGRRSDAQFHPLGKLLHESDILTLHVPLTMEGIDKTFHLIDREVLSLPVRQKILINTSRGEVVDNPALREALKSGRMRGAALDVWEGEPAADPQLIDLADIATPHIAGYSVDGKANATVSSVRVVASELGLPMQDWTPATLPQPDQQLINLTGRGSASPIELVAIAVNHTYPIEADDRLFRKNRENFEYLRDNYRIRREFSSYMVRTNDPKTEHILTELGFKIIK